MNAAAIHAARGSIGPLTLAVVMLGAAGYCIADGNPQLFLGAAVVLSSSWLLTAASRTRMPRGLPSWAISLMILAATIKVIADLLASGTPVVSDLATYLLLVTLAKSFDRKDARDHAQLMSLGAFLAIAGALTGNSLELGVILMGMFPVGIAAVLALQRYSGLEAVARARHAAGLPPEPAAVDPRARFSQRWTALSLSTLCLAMSVVIFVVTPRSIGRDAFGRWSQPSLGRVTGFSDEVRLGQSGTLSESETPVMDVVVTAKDADGRTDRNIGASMGWLYLRGAVLDTYDLATGSWIVSDESSLRFENAAAREPLDFPTGQWHRQSSKVTQEITLRDASRLRYLFAMWRPVSFTPGHTIPLELYADGDDRMMLRVRPLRGRFGYTVTSALEHAERMRRPPVDGRWVPRGVRDLARGVLHDAGADASPPSSTDGPEEWNRGELVRLQVGAFTSFLRSRYQYTLSPEPAPPGVDPIEHFLLSTRSGHCEYFASALVAMCRSVGIESRVVTGYLTNEFNAMSGAFTVRESNAHAWAEVFVPSEGWRTFDATPPAQLEQMSRQRDDLWSNVRRLYAAVDFAWVDSVVAFDDNSRGDLLSALPRGIGIRLAERAAELAADARDAVRSTAHNLRERGTAAAAAALLVAAGLGYGAFRAAIFLLRFRPVGRLWNRRGRRARSRDLSPSHARAAWVLRRMNASLARLGMAPHPHEPVLSHARWLARVDAPLSDEAAQLADAYYRLRFADSPTDPHTQRHLDQRLTALEQRVRAILAGGTATPASASSSEVRTRSRS